MLAISYRLIPATEYIDHDQYYPKLLLCNLELWRIDFIYNDKRAFFYSSITPEMRDDPLFNLKIFVIKNCLKWIKHHE